MNGAAFGFALLILVVGVPLVGALGIALLAVVGRLVLGDLSGAVTSDEPSP